MQVVQYKGPFSAGEVITIPAQYDYEYVHIGIQLPHRQPIAYITDSAVTPDLEFGSDANNMMPYHVNECNILEFDEISQLSWRIRFLKDIPMEGIIDIVYKVTTD